MIKITASKGSEVKYSLTSKVFLNSNSVRVNIFLNIPVRFVQMVSFLPILTMLKKYILSYMIICCVPSVTVRFKFYITTFPCSFLCFFIIIISLSDAHLNSMLLTMIFSDLSVDIWILSIKYIKT